MNVIFQILPLIDQEGTRSETATARASAETYRWFNLLQLQLKIQLKKKILQLQDSITIKDSFWNSVQNLYSKHKRYLGVLSSLPSQI